MRTYAIGDIHGQLDMLKAAHARIAADRKDTGDDTSPVVHLGDLIDRGPHSKGVVEFIMDGIATGEPWVVIKGNHDRYLERFLNDGRIHDENVKSGLSWFHYRLGGAETLASYGVQADEKTPLEPLQKAARAAVPAEHHAFLTNLPLYYERGEILFVHAGIRPGIALKDQDEEDLLWIRAGFLDDPSDHGPLVVHGHTALMAATRYPNRIGLDSAAGYGLPLTAAVFEGREVWVLGDAGREDMESAPIPDAKNDPRAYRR